MDKVQFTYHFISHVPNEDSWRTSLWHFLVCLLCTIFFFHCLSLHNKNEQQQQKIFIGGAAVHKELQVLQPSWLIRTVTKVGAQIQELCWRAVLGSNILVIREIQIRLGSLSSLLKVLESSAHCMQVLGRLVLSSPQCLLETSTKWASANTATVIWNSTSILKPSLHCLGGHIAIPVGGASGISQPQLLKGKLSALSAKKSNNGSLTVAAAQQEQDDYIKPRTLFTRAQEVAKNGKKQCHA